MSDDRGWRCAGQPVGELYDRSTDPDELGNLDERRASAPFRAQMTEALARELMEADDTGVRPAAAAQACGRRARSGADRGSPVAAPPPERR